MIEIDKRIFGPDLLPQLFPSDQFARSLQEDGADLKRLALQVHLHAVLAQLAGLEVGLKDSETNNLSRTADYCHVLPQARDRNSSTIGQLLKLALVYNSYPNC
jgi:hypothetical protein